MAKSYITLDTRIDAFKDEFNGLVNKVGDLATLTTTGDSDLVQAINEHSAELGTITAGAMGTTASTVSTAIAELDSEADSDRTNLGANVKAHMLADGVSAEVTATANNSANETVYLTFVDGATGAQGIETDTGLSYNPSTGNLAIGGELAAATLDISGNIDIDGTTNLDAVDIDGAVQVDATLTVGVDDTGYDVKLFGDTASAFMQWDASADDLILGGAAGLIVPDGQLTLGSTALTSTATELNLLDGVSGLVQADFTKLAAVTSSAAEINLLDGVSGLVQADFTKLAAVDATATELNIMDGGTSATSTTIADADRVVVNDAGTMKQVAVTDLAAYFDDEITAMPNLVTTAATTVGALNSGSITSGFGSIDVGSSSITTTGAISGGSVTVGSAALNEAELEILDGATVTTAELNILDGATITVAELNVLDGTDAGNASNNAITVADGDALIMNDGGTMRQVDISLLKSYFGQVDGGTALTTIDIDGASDIGAAIVDADLFVVDDGASGANRKATASRLRTYTNAGLLTRADQTNITTLGRLDSAQIDNITINGSTIGHVSDTDLINIASGQVTVAGEMQVTTLDIGGTNVTATAAELNILDGVTSTTAEINLLDGSAANTVVNSKAVVYGSSGELAGTLSTAAQGNITSLGTLSTLTVDDITINGSTISDASDLTIDAEGDIILDANDGDIILKDAGVQRAHLRIADQHLDIFSDISDKDIRFKGNDNGSTVTALTIDMSDAGSLLLNNSLYIPDAGKLKIGNGSGAYLSMTATASELNILDGATITTTELNIIDGSTSASSITLADADRVVVNDAGTMKQVAMTDFRNYISSNITNDAITNAMIADNAVDTSQIAGDAVTSAKIADNAIGQEHLQDDVISGAEMKDLRTFEIKDSGGSALFTMYGAGDLT